MNLKKKHVIGTIGFFSEESKLFDGQSIRTLAVTRELEKSIGTNNIKRLSYKNFRKKPISFLLKTFKLLLCSKNILLFPAHNAVKLLVPITVLFKKILKVKIFYNVIGGWLPTYLTKNKWLLRYIKELDGIFVQTNSLKIQLENLGVGNIHVFPNFKESQIFDQQSMPYKVTPFKLCFFSRVTEKKGVIEMIEVIKEINSSEIKCTLDIYGQVADEFIPTFEKLKTKFPSYINYKGVIDSSKASSIIKDYYIQLFPTKYYTEGFPGSILDSYCAGVPVLASRWASYQDVIDEGSSGFTFAFNDYIDMKEKLDYLIENPEVVKNSKEKCLEKAKSLRPEIVIDLMLKVILGGVKERAEFHKTT